MDVSRIGIGGEVVVVEEEGGNAQRAEPVSLPRGKCQLLLVQYRICILHPERA